MRTYVLGLLKALKQAVGVQVHGSIWLVVVMAYASYDDIFPLVFAVGYLCFLVLQEASS